MQLLSCHIAVAGDDHNIVVREHDTAVTYPELLVLQALHGSENIRHLNDVGDVDRETEEERQRLMNLYGGEIVRQVFPVAHQDLPEMDRRLRRQRDVPKELAEGNETEEPEHHRARRAGRQQHE